MQADACFRRHDDVVILALLFVIPAQAGIQTCN
jgi:hypothetical protein